MRAVVTISGKTVQLPHQDCIKKAFLAVGNHTLKVRPVRRSGGQSSVNIAAQQGDPIAYSVFGALPNLPLNGFFSLTFCGIAGIDNCVHIAPSLFALIIPVVSRVDKCTGTFSFSDSSIFRRKNRAIRSIAVPGRSFPISCSSISAIFCNVF